MKFSFTDEQIALRDAVADMVAKECPASAVRNAWEGGPGYDPSLWGRLGAMGVFGLLVPEPAGGLGMSAIEMVLVMEEVGRAALPGPIVEQAAAAMPLVAAVPELAERWLEPALAGEAVVTFGPMGDAAGRGVVGTPWGAEADLSLVDHGGQLLALTRDDLHSAEPVSQVDGSWRGALLTPGGGLVVPDGDAQGRAGWERGALAAAAELVGLGARMVEMTVAYVTERRQFGVPVGSYQAVKHHLANAHLAVEYARPAVYRAAWSMARRESTQGRDVSFAKVVAGKSAALAGRVALQCHGAIGYSFEHDLHLWMKRAWVLQASWGDAAVHRARVARSVIAGHTLDTSQGSDEA